MSARTSRAALAAAFALLIAWPLGSANAAKTPSPVVVLGFDGADAQLVQKWMDSGELPNLAALRREGAFAPLGSTNPPQTPVSWASFSTGLSPGRTGVFDFLKRSPRDYLPDFAMNSPTQEKVFLGKRNPAAFGTIGALILGILAFAIARLIRSRTRRAVLAAASVAVIAFPAVFSATVRYLPQHRPGVVSHRQGLTFWQIAGDAGLRTKIIHVPGTFPAIPARGAQILSGLGVPDIRGTFGTYTLYTTAPLAQKTGSDTEMGGKVVLLPRGRDEYETIIYGPYNKLFDKPPEILLALVIRVDHARARVTVEAAGRAQTLATGQWSDWFSLDFPFNSLFKAHGIARFHLIAVEPDLKLYLSSVNWNPMKPPLPVSAPSRLAADLARRFGLFKTVGWVEDTWALNEEVIDEHAYEEDVDFTVSVYEKMMEQFLREADFDLYVQVYSFTDRAGHMYWRAGDKRSPAYTPEVAAAFGDAIKKSYMRMDGIVGRARELMPAGATLIVCSDHGFSTWIRSVNYNTWLV
jgi:hypothetical protein